MIQFNNLNPEIPYQFLQEKYDEALNAGQRGIEAISISSYNKEISEVDSRYVNLKFISNDAFKIGQSHCIWDYATHYKINKT